MINMPKAYDQRYYSPRDTYGREQTRGRQPTGEPQPTMPTPAMPTTPSPGFQIPTTPFTPVGASATPTPGTTPTQRPGGSIWSDWGQTVNPANIQQDWFRDPSWGGHIIWNPQYGYQDYPTIQEQYAGAQGPVSQEQFGQWGLTPQFNPWQSYEQFAGRQTYGQQQAAQQGQGG